MGNSIIHRSLFLKWMTQFAFALVNLSSFETWVNFEFFFSFILAIFESETLIGSEAFSSRKFRNFHISDLSWVILSLKTTLRFEPLEVDKLCASRKLSVKSKIWKSASFFLLTLQCLTEKIVSPKDIPFCLFQPQAFWNDWIEKQLILLYFLLNSHVEDFHWQLSHLFVSNSEQRGEREREKIIQVIHKTTTSARHNCKLSLLNEGKISLVCRPFKNIWPKICFVFLFYLFFAHKHRKYLSRLSDQALM